MLYNNLSTQGRMCPRDNVPPRGSLLESTHNRELWDASTGGQAQTSAIQFLICLHFGNAPTEWGVPVSKRRLEKPQRSLGGNHKEAQAVGWASVRVNGGSHQLSFSPLTSRTKGKGEEGTCLGQCWELHGGHIPLWISGPWTFLLACNIFSQHSPYCFAFQHSVCCQQQVFS